MPGEEELANRGVSYCATCDGAYFRGKRVVVVGGGNSALDEGMFLARYVTELIYVHRRGQLRADPPLQRRAFDNPKVRFIWNASVSAILGSETVTGVRLRDATTGAETTLAADGVFPYIGHVPNTALFAGQIALDARGYTLTTIVLAPMYQASSPRATWPTRATANLSQPPAMAPRRRWRPFASSTPRSGKSRRAWARAWRLGTWR
ncbi:MAG TPA: FAD-dependent oxidoreductase [Roseiflexaceae bacterium]|nr:FAD-dependent oxidoreductase [Roseiflexaceae bacterium]